MEEYRHDNHYIPALNSGEMEYYKNYPVQREYSRDSMEVKGEKNCEGNQGGFNIILPPLSDAGKSMQLPPLHKPFCEKILLKSAVNSRLEHATSLSHALPSINELVKRGYLPTARYDSNSEYGMKRLKTSHSSTSNFPSSDYRHSSYPTYYHGTHTEDLQSMQASSHMSYNVNPHQQHSDSYAYPKNIRKNNQTPTSHAIPCNWGMEQRMPNISSRGDNNLDRHSYNHLYNTNKSIIQNIQNQQQFTLDHHAPPSPHFVDICKSPIKRRERWTKEEHAKFLEGLEMHGRKWKKIQAHVGSKTAIQVRTHAYGYFAKLLRNIPEDENLWEVAEIMSSLPSAVLKGPGTRKKGVSPETDDREMELLRKYVLNKKNVEDPKKSNGNQANDKLKPIPEEDSVSDSLSTIESKKVITDKEDTNEVTVKDTLIADKLNG